MGVCIREYNVHYSRYSLPQALRKPSILSVSEFRSDSEGIYRLSGCIRLLVSPAVPAISGIWGKCLIITFYNLSSSGCKFLYFIQLTDNQGALDICNSIIIPKGLSARNTMNASDSRTRSSSFLVMPWEQV